jgi:ATP-dependent RNA helicase DeaD
MDKLKAHQKHQLTGVQAQVIPTILGHRNFCLVGKRGEDRVTGYLLPALMYIDCFRAKATSGSGPRMVVLAANTNACVMIQKLAFLFGEEVNVKSELMSSSQKKEDADIVVSTPERFSKFVLDGTINLDRIQCLVLDELDEMLAAGLYPVLDRIMLKIIKTPTAQISVFCSTLPLDVRIFNEKYLSNTHYVQILIGQAYLAQTPLNNVTQTIHVIQDKEKSELLFSTLRGIYKDGTAAKEAPEECRKTVVFVEPVDKRVASLSESLIQRGYKVFVIDGTIAQEERVRRLADFKKAKTAILLTVNRMLMGSTMSK